MAGLLCKLFPRRNSICLYRCQSSWLVRRKPPPTLPARLAEAGEQSAPAKLQDAFSWMLAEENLVEVAQYMEQETKFAAKSKSLNVRIQEYRSAKWLDKPYFDGSGFIESSGLFLQEYGDYYYYFHERALAFERMKKNKRFGNRVVETRYPLFHVEDLGDFLKMKDRKELRLRQEMMFSPCGQFALLIGYFADGLSNCALVVSLAEGLTRAERLISIVTDVYDAAWCGSARLVFSLPDRWGKSGSAVRYADLWEEAGDGKPYRTLFHAPECNLLLEEEDSQCAVRVRNSRSGRYAFIHSQSPQNSTEVYVVDSHDKVPCAECVWRRSPGIECSMEHYKDCFYALANTESNGEFKIFRSQYSSDLWAGPETWSLFVNSSAECFIQHMHFQHDFCVLTMHGSDAQRYFHVVPLNQQLPDCLDFPYEQRIQLDDQCLSMQLYSNPSSEIAKIYYFQFGPGMPNTWSEAHLVTGEVSQDCTSCVFVEKVSGNPQKPATVIRHLTAVCPHDGSQIPITVVYPEGCRFHRMLVNVYGDVNEPTDMAHHRQWYRLLRLGWVLAFCHVRGSHDLGRQWYLNGSGDKKENSFLDLQTCIHYLHLAGFSRPDHTALYGFSAGGMLVAGLAQRQPSLFRAAVLHSPFVDVLQTYLDNAASGRHEPKLQDSSLSSLDDERTSAVASYCPFTNISQQSYPDILVTTSRHNPVIPVLGVARYVAKLRSMQDPWVFSDGRQEYSALWLNVTETDEHRPPRVLTHFLYHNHMPSAAELIFLEKAV